MDTRPHWRLYKRKADAAAKVATIITQEKNAVIQVQDKQNNKWKVTQNNKLREV